jgi:preprotein translocase subunit Sec63
MWIRLLTLLVIVVSILLWLGRTRRLPAGRATAPGWDPYAVLGVPSGASPDDVARAYREQMKRYHPDRVADLGPELQELAHRKALDIQRAYAELRGNG